MRIGEYMEENYAQIFYSMTPNKWNNIHIQGKTRKHVQLSPHSYVLNMFKHVLNTVGTHTVSSEGPIFHKYFLNL